MREHGLGAVISGADNGDFVDLMAVRIDNVDEPATPIPSLHDKTVLEVTRKNGRVIARSRISRQFDALVILQNLRAIGQAKIVSRHSGVPPMLCNSESKDH